MRKINFLLVSLLVVASGFFASCSKDDEGSDASINLVAGAGYLTGNSEVASGTAFKIKWTATSTTKDMKYVTITRDDLPINNWDLLEINSDFENAYNNEVTITAPISGGPYTYAVIIYDKDEIELSRVEFVITLHATAGSIGTYTSLNMGGAASSYGSYLDAEAGTVYKLAQVNGSTTVKNSIDVIFDAGQLWNSGGVFASSTGTKFALTQLNDAGFAAITDDASFSTYTASSDKITVSAGSVVFFQTKAGKKGLIRVISMTGGTGDLNIALKIQQ
jgi:hypothetical protein